MIASGSRGRRSLLVILIPLLVLLYFYAHGPPLFTPSTSWTRSFGSSPGDADFFSPKPIGAGPRIRQATMLFEGDKDNLRSMYERSVETHIKHGQRWGTPTHVLKRNLVEEGSYFNKPAYLLSLILMEMAKPQSQRADWIVWFDGDSVIMNPEIPWSLFIPPDDFPDIHILATRDNNGFNAGMLILRVDEWTVQTLSEVIALPGLKPDVPLPFFDQSALDVICSRPGYQEHFLYQPRRWWNRYHHDPDGAEAGNFLIHFAGISTVLSGIATKHDIMNEFLDKQEKTPQDWSRDISVTTYQKEVGAFWDSMRKAREAQQKAIDWRREHGERSAKTTELKEAESTLSQMLLKQSDRYDDLMKQMSRVESIVGLGS